MRDPALFGRRRGLDGTVAARAHEGDAVGDPVHVLLDRHDHVGQHRRAARAGHREQIGETRNAQPQPGARTRGPFVPQAQATAAADVDLQQAAGHRIEARGEDQAVQRVLLATCAHPGRRDRLDRRLRDIDQTHVGPIEGLVVAGVDAQALAADDLPGHQLARGLGILDGLGDPRPHELCRKVIGLLVQHQVTEGPEEDQATTRPALGEGALARFGAHRMGRLFVARHGRPVGRRHAAVARTEGRIVGLDAGLVVRVQRRVAGGHRIGGGALEHRQLARLLRDHRDRLQRRRTRADDAHTLAGEIDRLMGPQAGVEALPLEAVTPRDVGQVGRRQAAGGHHQEAGARLVHRCVVRALRAHLPLVGGLVVVGRQHARLEADAVTQPEALGHMLGVAQDLRLGGKALGPAPALLQLLGERVGVLQALDVAAGARIPVPVPGTAHATPGLKYLRLQPELTCLVQHVEAGEAGADDDQVMAVSIGTRPGRGGLQGLGHGGLLRWSPARCAWQRPGLS